ncbi:MAG TPA: DUF1631 family protein [Ramlibacter sp.]|nr:DUF1631 family protein [Ramlibacter sp.]
MNAPLLPPEARARLARQAREQFVTRAQGAMGPMLQAIRTRLGELVDTSSSSREMHERHDALMDFERKGPGWTQATVKAWQKATIPPTATARIRLDTGGLELLGEDVVERKILSSRLALAIGEKATWELNDLRVRMQYLEGGEELASTDVLRPEALSQLLVEQWGAAELTNDCWVLIQDVIRKQLLEHVPDAYKLTNQFLIDQDVMRDIDLSKRVRRGVSSPGGKKQAPAGETRPEGGDAAGQGNDPGAGYGGQGGSYGDQGGGYGGGQGGYGNTGAQSQPGGYGGQGGSYGGGPTGPGGYGSTGGQGGPGSQGGYGGPGGQGNPGGYSQPGGPGGSGPAGYGGGQGGPGGQGGRPGGPGGQGGYDGAAGGNNGNGYGGGGAQGGHTGPGGAPGAARGRSAGRHDAGNQGPASNHGAAGGRGDAHPTGVHDETRMQTSSPPLARARARATGVLGQLKRLLTDRVVGFESSPQTRPSPALAEALAQHQATGHAHTTQVQGEAPTEQDIVVYDDAAVQRVAVDLRQRTGELKKKATTSNEKAIIEIVALMFQAILSEERIPPAVRVWFARLQMPVLRVAISEPEFFGTLEHPARQLIDRMGSVVMGFDAAAIGGGALETEIKRVVQVIEQYPETGRRVFQLVYDEFQKFLSKFLTDNAPTQRVVSVAQQVEQKETLAIQYTIEMRSMLADMPVREEIREFLFKVWAEVLAMSAVKNGPQHEETLSLKGCASELVWSASAKPNRNERAKVIQDLPKLLQRLRQGMTLVGIQGKAQETHIKIIGDTLADAFLSKTEAIPQGRIEEMAKRLAHLEDFVADDPATDLPLDSESIEMMLGIDASNIEVVADGGSRPNAAMVAWAAELQLGNWFALDHNGATTQVQYVWRSDRKQLHLFAAVGGRNYLLQARRLASYLQAGLLLPAEEEALTVRATRDALAKLDANPERLLQ